MANKVVSFELQNGFEEVAELYFDEFLSKDPAFEGQTVSNKALVVAEWLVHNTLGSWIKTRHQAVKTEPTVAVMVEAVKADNEARAEEEIKLVAEKQAALATPEITVEVAPQA